MMLVSGIIGATGEAVEGSRSADAPAGEAAADGFEQFDVVDDVSDHRFVTRTELHQNPR